MYVGLTTNRCYFEILSVPDEALVIESKIAVEGTQKPVSKIENNLGTNYRR